MLVGGVDDGRLTAALAPHDEDIVLERPDDELVDAHGGVFVVRGTSHGSQGSAYRPGCLRAGPVASGQREGVPP